MKGFKRLSIFVVLVLTLFFLVSSTNVYADFWTDANDWYYNSGGTYDIQSGDGSTTGSLTADSTLPTQAQEIIDTFSQMVNIVGTTVIVGVTIFLGIKYIFGSFESKADVKESLANLLVACVFFFGWNSIWNILFKDGNLVFINSSQQSYTNALATVFNTVTNIANFLAIAGVLYIGIRYILAGASGKAELKGKSGQFILGIILSFCAVGFLNLISDIVSQVLA